MHSALRSPDPWFCTGGIAEMHRARAQDTTDAGEGDNAISPFSAPFSARPVGRQSTLLDKGTLERQSPLRRHRQTSSPIPSTDGHIVQEGPTGLNVVTMKTGYTMISFRVRTTKNHAFKNTFHQPFLRYGNPDLLSLGTLKIKIQIYRFLNTPCKILGSDLIFRVAIYLEIAKLALLWQP